MKRRSALRITLMLLTTSMISLMFNTGVVVAEEVIYIRPDGSVDPQTAPITRAGNVYTFTADIYKPIVIEKDNIIVDGDGYTLQGTGTGQGISIKGRSNVTIKKTYITGFRYGILMNLSTSNTIENNFLAKNELGAIWLEDSTTAKIANNIIAKNYCGILLTWSDNNTITKNSIRSNPFGIMLIGSNKNTITNNTMENSSVSGIWLDQSNAATIYLNNFISNTQQATTSNSTSTWDNGYPIGGNYWSDHSSNDSKSGPNQDQLGPDGIIDTPYTIDAKNEDRYPLKNPYNYTPNPDINNDGTVNIIDVYTVAKAFGSRLGDKTWNPLADINRDGIVNIMDIFIVARKFGKTWTTL
jgi:parallel beta-helix repeat protein